MMDLRNRPWYDRSLVLGILGLYTIEHEDDVSIDCRYSP